MHAVGVKHTQEYIKTSYVRTATRCTLTPGKEGMTKKGEEEGSREVMLRKPPNFIRRLSIKRKQGGGAGLEKYCPG